MNSGESNWFAGAGPIDINNGLEAINKDIKITKVLRDKQKIGSFIINALSITEGWSIKDDSRLYCSNRDLAPYCSNALYIALHSLIYTE